MPDPTSDPKSAAAHGSAAGAASPETDEQRADGTVEREVTDAPTTASSDRVAELEAAVTELRDRFLRAHAEMENLRRRTEREVQDAKRYAVSSFARDLLGVADNLRRALEAAGAGGLDDGDAADAAGSDATDPVTDPALAALIEGVELTERELLKALAKNGVVKLEPKGQLFDPHRHEAVFEAPDPSVPAGTVVQVMQEGYLIGDRILRPAMVGVARGGPKPETTPGGVDRKA